MEIIIRCLCSMPRQFVADTLTTGHFNKQLRCESSHSKSIIKNLTFFPTTSKWYVSRFRKIGNIWEKSCIAAYVTRFAIDRIRCGHIILLVIIMIFMIKMNSSQFCLSSSTLIVFAMSSTPLYHAHQVLYIYFHFMLSFCKWMCQTKFIIHNA